MILDQACKNVNAGKSIKKLWQRRFDHQNYDFMTHSKPSLVFMHGTTWDSSPILQVT